MASSSSSYLALFCTFFFLAIKTAAAEEFQVGDAIGWRIPAANETELYNVWASRRHFHVGDSLHFNYKNDSVAEVEKWGYYHCDPSYPIAFFNDGDTLVNLDKVGTKYFISGNSDHCKSGERMIVQVINLPSPPPQNASSPSTHTTPSTSVASSFPNMAISGSLSIILSLIICQIGRF